MKIVLWIVFILFIIFLKPTAWEMKWAAIFLVVAFGLGYARAKLKIKEENKAKFEKWERIICLTIGFLGFACLAVALIAVVLI